MAKRAERTFRHELGVADLNFTEPGYWDSLKKGLLAGDRCLVRREDAGWVMRV